MTAPVDPHPAPGPPDAVAVDLPITLGQFVKVAGLADTGGEAKLLITEGYVRLNDEIETRRGRKLAAGDVVEARGSMAEVVVRPHGTAPTRG